MSPKLTQINSAQRLNNGSVAFLKSTAYSVHHTWQKLTQNMSMWKANYKNIKTSYRLFIYTTHNKLLLELIYITPTAVLTVNLVSPSFVRKASMITSEDEVVGEDVGEDVFGHNNISAPPTPKAVSSQQTVHFRQ